MPYRSNDDIYRALNVVRQFNSHQQAVDEAPYGLGARAADTVKRINPFSKGGRIMAKHRKQSGNLANQVSDEWIALLGKKGYAKQAMGTVQDLRDFVQSKAPGTDVDAFLDQAGIPTATADAPVPVKLQDKFLLSIGQAMNAAGATGAGSTTSTTGTTDTGGGGSGSRKGGARDAAALAGDATSRKGTRREPVGSTPGVDGVPRASGVDGASGETPAPSAATDTSVPPFEPGDPVAYINTKGDSKQGTVVDQGDSPGILKVKSGSNVHNLGIVRNNIIHTGPKAPKSPPGLTPDGKIDILPTDGPKSPEVGDTRADREQDQFDDKVKIHDEVVKRLETWSQASRDKLKAQLTGASA